MQLTLTLRKVYKSGGASYSAPGLRASIYAGPKLFNGAAPQTLVIESDVLAEPVDKSQEKAAKAEAKAAAKAEREQAKADKKAARETAKAERAAEKQRKADERAAAKLAKASEGVGAEA